MLCLSPCGMPISLCSPSLCSSSSHRTIRNLLQSTHSLRSRQPMSWSFAPSKQPRARRRGTAISCVTDLPLIASEDDFEAALSQNKVVVVDWMARWCRKCIYLKPKIQKMMEEDFPNIPIVYIDVNAVPGQLVYGNGIKKMPTIALYQDKQKVAEHIAAEGGKDAVAKIKDMLETHLSGVPSGSSS